MCIRDSGGGASRLVDALLELGFDDLTVLDVSPAASKAATEGVASSWNQLRVWSPSA